MIIYDGVWCDIILLDVGYGLIKGSDVGPKYIGGCNKAKNACGSGVMEYPDGSRYEGEWKDGKRYGKGVLTHSGIVYICEWKDCRMDGWCIEVGSDGMKTEGQRNKGLKDGIFTATSLDGTQRLSKWNNDVREQGDTFQGQADGKGNLTKADGSVYCGDFKDTMKHGKGTWTSPNGKEKYVGEWRDDNKNGEGILTTPDGEYEGTWKDDVRHGEGTETKTNGETYIGGWEDDKRHGTGGFETKPNGAKYAGDWNAGKRWGQGNEYLSNGERYYGQWEDDKRHGRGTSCGGGDDGYTGLWDRDQVNFCERISFTHPIHILSRCVINCFFV